MPALNFKKQFPELIEAGKKPFTLRAQRRDGRDIVTGETIYMFTGMRTKACRKFATKPCLFHCAVIVRPAAVIIPQLFGYDVLSKARLGKFVVLDGFANQEEFFKFHADKYDTRFLHLIAWVSKQQLLEMINEQGN